MDSRRDKEESQNLSEHANLLLMDKIDIKDASPSHWVQLKLSEEFTDKKHESCPLFSQMEELVTSDDDMEWRETSRWIKFEEDVEKGGNRWSKPHVTTLSLPSLFELRKLILNGNVILDIQAISLEQISDKLLDNLANDNILSYEQIGNVKEILMKRHRHLQQRKHCTLSLLKSEKGNKKHSTSKTSQNSKNLGYTVNQNQTSEKSYSNTDIQHNLPFMRKIPFGAEASNILVGEVDFLEKTLSVFIRLNTSVILGNLTEVPVPTRFLFLLLASPSSALEYREIGRAMATLLSDEVFREIAYKAKNKNHLLAGIDEFLNALIVLPPGEWDPSIRLEPPSSIPSQFQRRKQPEKPIEQTDEEEEEQKQRESSGLARTGVLFGGLINDLKRKTPWYWSDFKDALATQCIASWIFLYFACLSPIITFGGLLAEATDRNMAAMESLVAGFVCGIGFGFFSGQPLNILGSTGPVLVFEAIVYDFCIAINWDYLSFRLWIGIWIAIILIILVAIDASAFVCYITRFTEENFATLVALIFIFKAVENVLAVGKKYPLAEQKHTSGNCSCLLNDTVISGFRDISNDTSQNYTLCLRLNETLSNECLVIQPVPDVYLMSILLFIGTFLISVQLKNFRNTSFLPAKVRKFISDFAVILAIIVMTLVDFEVGIATPKLEVPNEFKPTLPTRGWFIPPFSSNPFYSVFLAIPPALLGTILIFMDQQITSVIVNRREHKLKKGCGYHLDLFVLSLLILLCSIMGLPWFVAATVLSINHINSLKLESETTAPGDKPQFLGVREQRVTHILIFLSIGLSIFLTPMLRYIPMPVLFGVFLYMGVASLNGLQFFDRILIIFMPNKYQPDYSYLRQVPVKKIHLFTAIQIACMICLWLVKSFSQTSILFPLMLVVMIGIRKSLDCIFTQRELKILDDILPRMRPESYSEDKKTGCCNKISKHILGPKLQKEKQYIKCSQNPENP